MPSNGGRRKRSAAAILAALAAAGLLAAALACSPGSGGPGGLFGPEFGVSYIGRGPATIYKVSDTGTHPIVGKVWPNSPRDGHITITCGSTRNGPETVMPRPAVKEHELIDAYRDIVVELCY